MLVLWRVLEKLDEIFFSLWEIVKLFIRNADAQQTIAVGGCRFQTEFKRRERPHSHRYCRLWYPCLRNRLPSKKHY